MTRKQFILLSKFLYILLRRYYRWSVLNSCQSFRLRPTELEPVTLRYTCRKVTVISVLDAHLPNMRTVRTSWLIKFVALRQAALEARLGGEPVQTTEDFSSDVLQQEIFAPFKYAPWPSQAVNISSLNGSYMQPYNTLPVYIAQVLRISVTKADGSQTTVNLSSDSEIKFGSRYKLLPINRVC
jgi:hypothetical protein